MALGAKYPAVLLDANNQSRNGEFIQFTDDSDQPEPGAVFVGWTSDAADPANVASNDGDLDLGAGSLNAGTSAVGGVSLGSGNVAATQVMLDHITLSGDPGDTVMDANGELITNIGATLTANGVPRLSQLTSALTITSGTLPNTGAWVSGTAKVNPVSRDITVNVEVVFDGSANAATVAIAISPDNSTFTTVGTPGVSVGVNTAGASTQLVPVSLPAGWAIKLTIATHAAVAASIYY